MDIPIHDTKENDLQTNFMMIINILKDEINTLKTQRINNQKSINFLKNVKKNSIIDLNE